MNQRGHIIGQELHASSTNAPTITPGMGIKRTDPPETGHRLRVLVAIASFGEKNLSFLKRIIAEYRSVAMDVDIIVHSEAPKSLDLGVKVIVGLPSRNPHSLPFAHKRTFAENADRYNLFVYSEDDMEVGEKHIRAFLAVVAELKSDEIPGYIRYEVEEGGIVSLPDVHGHFHWKPESVRQRGGYAVAEFTNEHAGFYILTQTQLRRAIASGAFLRDPYEGRYGMLETGATDPYTCCGFRKVICISAFDDFLIHHMPNRYAGVLGVPLNSFKEQIKTLMDIYNGDHPATTLCEVEPSVLQQNWSKSFFESPRAEILGIVPVEARSILSLGCGWGDTEIELMKRGAKVTALPLDSVIGPSAAQRGIEVVNGSWSECFQSLNGREFDCLLMTNLLHLLPDPWAVLGDYARLVKDGGAFVIAGYNFMFLPHLLKRLVCIGDYRKLRSFEESGMHPHGIGAVKKQIQDLGFRVISLRWFDHAQPRRMRNLPSWAGRYLARNWVIQARRAEPGEPPPRLSAQPV